MRNFMNGFLISFPVGVFGAMMYNIQWKGNSNATDDICISFCVTGLRRNPGSPSYQMVANSCWMLGWATNWNVQIKTD